MVNYSNGKIYKLVSIYTEKCYVGSTVTSLSNRKSKHKNGFLKWKEGKYHKVTSFDIYDLGVDDVEIVLLEKVICESKEELHARERYWVETLDCVNRCVPGRTKKEYYQDNRESNIEKAKEYRQINKQKISEKRKEKIICETCNCDTSKNHKARHERSQKHQRNLQRQKNISIE